MLPGFPLSTWISDEIVITMARWTSLAQVRNNRDFGFLPRFLPGVGISASLDFTSISHDPLALGWTKIVYFSKCNPVTWWAVSLACARLFTRAWATSSGSTVKVRLDIRTILAK